ncbi:MAG: MFS transporter [Acidimicrobiales bacterium]
MLASAPARVRAAGGDLRRDLGEVLRIPDLGRYWIGQFLSDLGSEATLFVLMAAVYLETGSLWQFALLFALDNLPDVILSPVAGTLVDRYDRRVLHLIGDGGAALVTVVALVLFATDSLGVPAIYALMLIGSSFESLQGAAAEAVWQSLVPPSKLVRAGAVLDPFDELVDVIAPVVGAVLLATLGIGAVFAVDLVTFGIAIYTLFTLGRSDVFRAHLTDASSNASAEGEEEEDDDESSWQFFSEGITLIRSSRGLRFLFVYGMADGFWSSLLLLMAAATAMELGGEATLATVQSASGAGAVFGMVAIAVFGLVRGNVITRNVLGPGIAIGVALLALPIAASAGSLAVALAVVAFVVMALSAPLDAAIDATYLSSVPSSLIGRTSAVFDTVGGIANLVLLLLVAPAVDLWLAPALADGILAVGGVTLIDAAPTIAPLVAMLGLAGLALVALNVWAFFSANRHDADWLASAVETRRRPDPIAALFAYDSGPQHRHHVPRRHVAKEAA